MAEKILSEDAYKFVTEKYPHFQFPNWDWKGANKEMTVICPDHREFLRTYKDLRRSKFGCPRCSGTGSSNKKTTEEFLDELKELYGEDVFSRYDFSKVEYTDALKDVVISCPEHGEFTVRPNSLLSRKNSTPCGDCNRLGMELGKTDTLEEFISKAVTKHGDRYTYEKVDYKGSKQYVEVTCKSHGVFQTQPGWLISGKGCPSCAMAGRSRPEEEIRSVITDWGINCVQHHRLANGKEVDIFIPSLKLGIEYNGLYFHSEKFYGPEAKNYHRDKLKASTLEDIRLVQIFEDEWVYKKDIVISRLQSLCNLSPSIFARKCNSILIDETTSNEFLDLNHIQGRCRGSSIRYGLMHDDTLVAVMTLGPIRFGDYEGVELLRYCSKKGISVTGGFSKLLSISSRGLVGNIFSYSDRRWSLGGVYVKNGFVHAGTSDPGYFWCKNQNRYNRQGFMKHKLKDLWPDIFSEDKTESDMCQEMGYNRVWDCGQDLWVLNINK